MDKVPPVKVPFGFRDKWMTSGLLHPTRSPINARLRYVGLKWLLYPTSALLLGHETRG